MIAIDVCGYRSVRAFCVANGLTRSTLYLMLAGERVADESWDRLVGAIGPKLANALRDAVQRPSP